MTEPILEIKALMENMENDLDLLKRIIEIFLADCPEKLAAIRAAVVAQNSREVMKVAHSLRGSVGVFGARSAVDAAQNLESMGREEKKEGFGEAFALLEQEMALVMSALQEIAKQAV